jgi:hypothetical protein
MRRNHVLRIQTIQKWIRRGWLLGCLTPLLLAACNSGHLVLIDQVEARRLSAELRAEFSRANEAANRAVMADTEEASRSAAAEAREAIAAVDRTMGELSPILQSLKYTDEQKIADSFTQSYSEFKTLNEEVLSLAVENTNLKAQRLAWGDGQKAADDLEQALRDAARGVPASSPVLGYASAAEIGLLGIRVIEPRHIAEADDQAMTRMEAEMAEKERNARSALDALRRAVPPGNAAAAAAAAAAFDRFMQVHAQVIDLSRRNTNVRSLALTLGRKRLLAAACADRLGQLEEALGQHQFKATR